MKTAYIIFKVWIFIVIIGTLAFGFNAYLNWLKGFESFATKITLFLLPYPFLLLFGFLQFHFFFADEPAETE